MAIEELSVLTDDAACSVALIHELVQLIECGRRKRKVSETQSVGSSRRYFYLIFKIIFKLIFDSSSSSSSYEEEFPSLGPQRSSRAAAPPVAPKSAPPWQPHEKYVNFKNLKNLNLFKFALVQRATADPN